MLRSRRCVISGREFMTWAKFTRILPFTAISGAANRLTHITAFHVGELGTAGAAVSVTGLAAGTLTFEVAAPGMLNFSFNPPLPASGANTAIVVTAAANASATAVAVTATGFQA